MHKEISNCFLGISFTSNQYEVATITTPKIIFIMISSAIDEMFVIYPFLKIGPIFAFFSKIGPKISNILSMAHEVTIILN